MGEFVLTNVQVFMGSFDYSGYGNTLDMNYGAEMIDVTTFNVGFRKRLPSFEVFDGTLNGFLDDETTGAVDTEIESRVSEAAEPMGIIFGTGAIGDPTYLSNSIVGTYNLGGGAVGEAGTFSFEFANQGTGAKLVQGYTMAYGQKTATGNESGVQAGAVDYTTSGQKAYAAIHVVSWDGTTTSVDAKIVSDDTNTFPTATDRITFTQLTAVGSEFKTLAADVTDDWWRAEITLAGASPDVTLMISFGIK